MEIKKYGLTTILSSVIITALVVGLGVYFWQNQLADVLAPTEPEPTEEVTDIFIANPATTLSLDASDPLCNQDPYERPEIGGLAYPTHDLYYYHSESSLGALFTAMACGDERVEWYAEQVYAEGTNASGIYATIYPGPSAELEQVLLSVGFELQAEGPKYKTECDYDQVDGRPVLVEGSCESIVVEDSYHEEWALTSKIPYEELMQLRDFTDESWSSNWGGLAE